MKTSISHLLRICNAFVGIALLCGVTSCSSVHDQASSDSRDYYGYHNPTPRVQEQSNEEITEENNLAMSPGTENANTPTTTQDQGVYSNSPSSVSEAQYSTTYADGTPLVINNYYSSAYTPVITPWWNTYYSSWSYMQPGIHIGFGYSPWTSWRSMYDPFYGAEYTWGSNWYAPWYGCNPYYGFGYRPYYTYYDSYYGRPWYAQPSPWGGYNDGYTSSSSRYWGSGHAISGSAGSSASVGGYANPGGRERAVPLGTSNNSAQPATHTTGFGRVRTETVGSTDSRNTSTTNGVGSARTGNSPFEEPKVSRPDQGRIRPASQSSVDVPNSQRNVAPARATSTDAQSVPRMDYNTRTTRREFVLPHGAIPSSSSSSSNTTASTNSKSSTSAPAASSGSHSSSSSGGGRRR